MSAPVSGTSEDYFLCAICLEVFTDPVSTQCGHNFCKSCISTHWDSSVRYKCPMCKKEFTTKPELDVNTLIAEVASQFRRESEAPDEVPCDVCNGDKVKALKSCQDCGLSFCKTHLTASCLRRHQLLEPVANLEKKIKKMKEMMNMLEMKTQRMFERKKTLELKINRMKRMKNMTLMKMKRMKM